MKPPMLTVVRFTQVGRSRGNRGEQRHAWVYGVKWGGGPGYKVKSLYLTPDREKAARFTLVAAQEIVAQYYNSPATLERPDGTPMPEETRKLQEDQFRRNAEAIRNREEIRGEWSEFFAEMTSSLAAIRRTQ